MEHSKKIQRAHDRIGDTFRTRFISAGGMRIKTHYIQAEHDSPTLVFLHGWGSRSEVWFPLLEEMKNESFGAVLVDLPGFGGSDTPHEPLNVADFSGIVSDIIETYELSPVVLVGHSFGGQVATKLAAQEPELVKRLILINSASVRRDNTTFVSTLASFVKPIFELPLLNRFKNRILGYITGADYEVNPQMYPTMKRVIQEDMTESLDDIKQPTLIIWGENDDITPPGQAYTISENIPQALLMMLPKAGHYSFLDDPQTAAANIRSFIEHSQ